MNDIVNIISDDDPNDIRDLDWQAFRYVSLEMSLAESGAFEAQLATDQSAREAVAKTVQLLAAIVAGAHPTTEAIIARPQPHGRRKLGAALVTVAAAGLAYLSLVHYGGSAGDNSPARELVSLWADSKSMADDSVEADAASNGESEELIVPGWMMAAVETAADTKAEEN